MSDVDIDRHILVSQQRQLFVPKQQQPAGRFAESALISRSKARKLVKLRKVVVDYSMGSEVGDHCLNQLVSSHSSKQKLGFSINTRWSESIRKY